MKVLKSGNLDSSIRRFTCPAGSCLWVAGYNECVHGMENDCSYYSRCECPECGARTYAKVLKT